MGAWSAERKHQEARIAVVLFLTVLSAYLVRVSLSVALPFIAKDFAWTPEQLGGFGGVLLGIFLVGYGISNILLSPLADCYGPRKALFISIAVWSMLTLFTGIVGMYYAVFVVLRTSLGMSQGIIFPAAGKITQAWFPPERRSRMNALYYAAIAFANILSPLFLIPLIMVTSWNVMFIFLAGLGFVLLIPTTLWLKDTPQGMQVCEHQTLRAKIDYTKDHLRQASKTRGLFVLTLSHALEAIAFWGLSLWLPTFLVMARGFSTEELIWAASLPYLGYIVGLLIGSELSDRNGHRSRITGLFCFGAAVTLLSMYFIAGQWETIFALVIVFFFISLFGPNIATMLQGCCKSGLTCSATGIENGIANGLGALGPIIIGIIVAMTGQYESALLFLAALLVLAGVVILRFRTHEAATCPPS
jgi:sugar phosphate permease